MQGHFDEALRRVDRGDCQREERFPPLGNEGIQVLRQRLRVARGHRDSNRRTHDAYSDWLCSRMNCGR